VSAPCEGRTLVHPRRPRLPNELNRNSTSTILSTRNHAYRDYSRHYSIPANWKSGMGVGSYEARRQTWPPASLFKLFQRTRTAIPSSRKILREAAQPPRSIHPGICTIHGIEERDGRTFSPWNCSKAKPRQADPPDALPIPSTIDIGIQPCRRSRRATEGIVS